MKRVGKNGNHHDLRGHRRTGLQRRRRPRDPSQISYVDGLALDASGSLYIADAPNHRIRKVTPDGTISTIAGTGASATAAMADQLPRRRLMHRRGLAFDAAGNLYFADNGAQGRPGNLA